MLCRFPRLLAVVLLATMTLPIAQADESGKAGYSEHSAITGPSSRTGGSSRRTQVANPQTPQITAPPQPIAKVGEQKVEEVTERYPNGVVKLHRHVVLDADRNYVNHGLWTLHDTNGTPIAKGSYYQGKRQGTWSRLQPKSARNFTEPEYRGFTQPFAWEAHFNEDKLHGLWTMIDAEGRQMRTWEFEDGRLHGRAIDWRPDGKKRREAQYHLGIPCGETREWNEAGKLVSAVPYRDGQPIRAFVDNYASGKKRLEGAYLGPAEKVRVTVNWWEGRMVIETSRVEGKEVRHGKWIAWHPDGNKEYEGEYANNLPTGVHTWWHANGQKHICGQFVSGHETGRWTWWHDNGHRSLDGEFLEGRREGTWTSWHANGRKNQTGAYLGNQKQGTWITWDDHGKVIASRDHTASADLKGVVPEGARDLANQPDETNPPAKQVPAPVPELLQRWKEHQNR